MKKLLTKAEAELAASHAQEKRLQARLDQLSAEMTTTEESISQLNNARQIALRKAAIEATNVEIDRSGLSAMQFRRDELEEMAEVIRAALADIQKDRPRLVADVGTARRAFMAEASAAIINRIFGKISREELVNAYVLNMGAMNGAQCKKLGELSEVMRAPGIEEVQAAMLRVKAELGFDPC